MIVALNETKQINNELRSVQGLLTTRRALLPHSQQHRRENQTRNVDGDTRLQNGPQGPYNRDTEKS